ncbi:beta-agarase [Aquimarina sp. AD10]|uniref:Beta-agarase n=1 Tax=Aquimarina aggregata TaxID=1642818 RepID=A0A162X400_9FLAO|nr:MULTISPECIES: beta-agarase [Aquimarina]AXT60534.1 beta-agarase [Aquimarina sp. AD10]KZS38406.1 beta-agarase [Aquimarina aggregata]RKN01625.1 beta-agarase [Aquimarina sp. AD10]
MYSKITVILFFSFVSLASFSQEAKVTIDLSMQKFIGAESELKREKYFNIHSSFSSWDLASHADVLFDQLDINFGRTFGGPSPFQKSKTQVPKPSEAKARGINTAKHWKNAPLFKKYKTNDLIITDHPANAFQLNMDYEKIAAYNVEYLKNAFPIMPKYYEVMNEPFVHSKDYVKTWAETDAVILEMTKLHKVIADKIHAEIPDIMVGGYSSAWPEVDRKNFDHWNTRMKSFMDTAGESMKFFATHLYDGRNVTGNYNYRSGSNSEAILDLIETYSYKKWGIVKPHLISEYGYTSKGLLGKPHSPELNGVCLKSYNNILMSLLDKPDRLLKSIPFIVGEGNWFYKDKKKNPDGHPYPWVIVKKNKDGVKEFTDLKKFYELWKGVSGKRVDVISSNPDIQVNAFIQEKKAYIALNNLHDKALNTTLAFLRKSKEYIQSSTLRRLYTTDAGIPKLVYFTDYDFTKDIVLKSGETVILECNLTETPLKSKITENNYYSKTYLQKVEAKKTIQFTIDNVTTGKKGRAAIKMGIGRAHDLSKKPQIVINGKPVEVPENWAGYDQKSREQFFGVINIPFDIRHTIKGENKIDITFPDTGGHVSSVILNIEKIE